MITEKPAPPASDSTPVLMSVVARNQLAQARVLVDSFRQFHPTADCRILLLDDAERAISAQGFRIIRLQDIVTLFPRIHELTFQFDAPTLAWTLTPIFFRYLLEIESCDRVLAVQPQTYFLGPATDLDLALRRANLALIPRRLGGGVRAPGIPAGVFDPGMIGMRRGPRASAILDWWEPRSRRSISGETAPASEPDPLQLDWAPALFPGVRVLRHAGYGLARWNLDERPVSRSADGTWQAGGVPLVYAHVGYDSTETLSPEKELDDEYQKLLLRAGHRGYSPIPYAFDFWDNGWPIPSLAREIYADPKVRARFPEPHRTAGESSFYSWMMSGANGRAPPLARSEWKSPPNSVTPDSPQASPDSISKFLVLSSNPARPAANRRAEVPPSDPDRIKGVLDWLSPVTAWRPLPFPSAFLGLHRSPEEFPLPSRSQLWLLARDGQIPLTLFFRRNPDPGGFRGKLLISRRLGPLVPSPWHEQVLLYSIDSGARSVFERRPLTHLVLCGMNSELQCQIPRLRKLLAALAPLPASCARISAYLPVLSWGLGAELDSSFSGRFVAEICRTFGTNVQWLSTPQFLELRASPVSREGFLELGDDLWCAQSAISLALGSQGFEAMAGADLPASAGPVERISIASGLELGLYPIQPHAKIASDLSDRLTAYADRFPGVTDLFGRAAAGNNP